MLLVRSNLYRLNRKCTITSSTLRSRESPKVSFTRLYCFLFFGHFLIYILWAEIDRSKSLFVRGENKLKQRCDVIILRYQLPVTVESEMTFFRSSNGHEQPDISRNRYGRKIQLSEFWKKYVSQTEFDVDVFVGKWVISEKTRMASA